MLQSRVVLAAAIIITVFQGIGLASQTHREVRVGVYDYAPLVSLDRYAYPEGLFVDIVKEVAAERGWKITYVNGTWQNQLDWLKSGKIDLVLCMSQTQIRAAQFDINKEPGVPTWAQICVPKNKPIDTVMQLDKKRIAGLQGDIYFQALKDFAHTFGVQPTYITCDTIGEAFRLLAMGKVDAVGCERTCSIIYERKFRVGVSPIMFFPQTFGFATTKGKNADLLNAFDEYFRTQKKDTLSHYSLSTRKWLSNEDQFAFPAYLVKGLVVSAALLLIFMVTSAILRRQVSIKTRELSDQNELLQAQIGDRIRAEKKLELEKKLTDTIVNAMPGLLFVIDRNGKTIWWNRYVDDVLGPPREGKRYRETLRLMVEEDRDTVAEAICDILVTGESDTLEYRMIHQDSTIHYYYCTGTLAEIDGAPCVVGFGIDVTERKSADIELRALEENKRNFYRETLRSVTGGKLQICEPDDIQPYLDKSVTSIELNVAPDVGEARREVKRRCLDFGLSEERTADFVTGCGEAFTNAIKHGGNGRVCMGHTDDNVWMAVVDHGSGIESLILPSAILRRGFSTKVSMGLGYSIMLDVTDHILLKTGSEGTTVLLMKNKVEKKPEAVELPDTWASNY